MQRETCCMVCDLRIGVIVLAITSMVCFLNLLFFVFIYSFLVSLITVDLAEGSLAKEGSLFSQNYSN